MAVTPGLVALGISAYVLSLPDVLAGIHGYSGYGYDDGVFLGTALRFVHGAIPYRDFDFVHPPGITLLMTPIALLGRVLGSRNALVMARCVTAGVVACNASLAAWIVRSRGRGAMLVAGLGLACFPLAVTADHTLLLEPYLVLACLVGTVAMFGSSGALQNQRGVFWAGIAFGFAGAIKLWALFPVVVAVCCCIPFKAHLRRLVTGLVIGFGVTTAPFFVLAPRTMVHDVIVSQLSRGASGRGNLSVAQRLVMMFGLGPLETVAVKATTAIVVACALLTVVFVVFVSTRSKTTRLEGFLAGSAASTIAGMAASQQFYDHYAYFPAAFLAMLVGTCIGRVGDFLRRVTSRLTEPTGRAVAFTGAIVFAAALVVGTALLIARDVDFARDYLRPSDDPGRLVAQFFPEGACTAFDEAIVLIVSDRFPSEQSCKVPVDPFGLWLTDNHATPPPANPPFPEAFTSKWRAWLESADYVVLSVPQSNYIPWTPDLVAWFNTTYRLTLDLPRTYVYERIAPHSSGRAIQLGQPTK
jgi:Glycosyltransferase family 87